MPSLVAHLRPLASTIAIVAAIVIAAPARGQVELEAFEPLEVVEPGATDLGPLGTSLRDLRLDFRTPSNFDQVFRVPGEPELLMRVHGALYAVFPRSVYEQSLLGPVPIVPNDTVFYIGANSLEKIADRHAPTPVVLPRPAERSSRLDLRSDLRLTLTSPDGEPLALNAMTDSEQREPRRSNRNDRSKIDATRPPLDRSRPSLEVAGDESPSPPIVGDAEYRSRRMHELMRRAADAITASVRDTGPAVPD